MKGLYSYSLMLLLTMPALSHIVIAAEIAPPKMHMSSGNVTDPKSTVNEDLLVTTPDRDILYSVTQDDYVWKNGPASFPGGTSYTVLEGDPYGAGPYTIRIKFPPYYKLPALAHDDLEELTVISGVLYIALGDKFKEKEDGLHLPA